MNNQKCKSCQFELYTIDKKVLEQICDELHPCLKSPSLPTSWQNSKSKTFKICPRCDMYALGIETYTHYPINSPSGEIVSIHNICEEQNW